MLGALVALASVAVAAPPASATSPETAASPMIGTTGAATGPTTDTTDTTSTTTNTSGPTAGTTGATGATARTSGPTAGTTGATGASGGVGQSSPQVEAIHAIQGAAHRSPLTGRRVTTTGVVTAVAPEGYWLQDPRPDEDPATSEGLYVHVGRPPTAGTGAPLAAGDVVSVTGTVAEYRSAATSLTTTELTDPVAAVTAQASQPPAATPLGPGGLVPPTPVRTDAPGDVEASPVFDPAANALDFLESLEGMLVRVEDATVVGPRNAYGEVPVLPRGEGSPRTVRGGIRYTAADANPERVILDDALAATPTVDVGDRLPGVIDGVFGYSYGNYKLQVLATPAVVAGGLPREATRQPRPGELTIATYNLENLDPTDPVAKFDGLAAGLVDGLAAPDIVAVEEVQDDTGPADDGVVTADVTFRMLIDAILRAGGPRYDYRSIDPVDGADGGEGGGNIRVGLLFRTDRCLSFVDRPGGDATTPTGVRRHAGRAALTVSPGRVDPANAAFVDSRKPLAGEFRYRGRPLIVVANHFNSKGGDQPLFGRYQPPARSTQTQRTAQASVVRGFVDAIRAADANARVVVLGDLNDFEFSQPLDILVGDGWLVDLPRTLPEPERYGYLYEGNSQVLDHILVSAPATRGGVDYDVIHRNAEYADRASDHDPQIVRLRL